MVQTLGADKRNNFTIVLNKTNEIIGLNFGQCNRRVLYNVSACKIKVENNVNTAIFDELDDNFTITGL